MFKVIILSLIASAAASAAIAADGITYRPFIRAIERRGEPVISETFIGKEAPFGDETAFAGISLPDLAPRTGP